VITERNIQSTLKWLTVSLGALSVCFVVYALTGYQPQTLEGRLVPAHMRGAIPWQTITAEEIENGVTAPPHINVLMHIPESIWKIQREILLGHKGKDIQYWGYCFPENYTAALSLKNRGFPGRLFLSEKEREVRREQELLKRRQSFRLSRDFSDERLNEEEVNRGRIRHQMELFKGGSTCYLMTEAPLSLGTDEDEDGLNIHMERDKQTAPLISDTDGDGIMDGTEVISLGTSPTMRDSDGDGIVDGLEDKNRNGKIDGGETNPTRIDSDRDGLCDGLCRVGTNGVEVRGEDVNLNGEVDDGETDPKNPDSDGDGILDEQEYFNCQLGGGNCDYSAFPL